MVKSTLKHLLCISLFLIGITAFAQSNIRIGEKAPAIKITDWIENTPADKDLAGKYIVLEFWATWCGPCIAAVPHMNELQKEFNRKDLYYISISDEPVEKIKRTLKRVDFKSIVVTDQTGQTQKNYGDKVEGLQAIPLTVLIDNKGIVKWVGLPTQLTQKVMADFLNGKVDSDTRQTEKITQGTETQQRKFSDLMALLKDKETTYYFELQESQATRKSKMAIGTKAIELKGYTLEDIYTETLNKKAQHLEIPDNLKSKRIDLLYKNSRGDEQSLLELEQEILKKLGITKTVEPVKVKGFAVSVKDKSLLEETMGEKGFAAKSDADDKLIFTAYTIASTLDAVSDATSEQFQFVGKDDTKYDFIIATTSKEEILKSLRSYGLEVTAKTFDAENIKLKAGK